MSLKIIFLLIIKVIQDRQYSLRLKLAYDIKVSFEKKNYSVIMEGKNMFLKMKSTKEK